MYVYYVCLQDLVHHPWACFTLGCCDYTADGGLSAEHSDRISVSNLVTTFSFKIYSVNSRWTEKTGIYKFYVTQSDMEIATHNILSQRIIHYTSLASTSQWISELCVCVVCVWLTYSALSNFQDLQVLLKASANGDTKTVSALLKQGMDANVRDEV